MYPENHIKLVSTLRLKGFTLALGLPDVIFPYRVFTPEEQDVYSALSF